MMEDRIEWLRVHRWLATAAGMALLALYTAWTSLLPQAGAAYELFLEWRGQQEKVAGAVSWETEKVSLETHRRALELHYESLYISLPRSDQMSVILQRLQEEAHRCGVVLQEVRPQDRIAHARYDELPLQVEIEGGFEGLGLFVEAIERSQYLMKVSRLHLERAAPASEWLHAGVLLHVIILREEPAEP